MADDEVVDVCAADAEPETGAVAFIGVVGTNPESITDFCDRADIIAKTIQLTPTITENIFVIVAANVVAPVAPSIELEDDCEVKTPPPFES